jgi:transcriptional regulator with XRE-family HTH domain
MKESDLLIKMGKKIKAIRLSKNMTQNELAIACEFEKATMSRIESGQTNSTVRTLLKISNGLEVHIVDLLND